jgi:hypothetical protein
MHIEITLLLVSQVAEEQALLDSGASENLINKETIETDKGDVPIQKEKPS